MSGEKVYQPNMNAAPLANERRIKRLTEAANFAKTCKDAGMPKNKVVLNLKNNYLYSTHDARIIYTAATRKPARIRHERKTQ